VLAAVCGFLLLKSLGHKMGQAGNIVRTVGVAAFGIYLVHIFVVELLRRGLLGFRLYSWMGPSIHMIPLTALAVYALSFIIVFGMQKIPVIKTLVP
jgi:surface polysaccharide O-acyltransferase-like enzyme